MLRSEKNFGVPVIIGVVLLWLFDGATSNELKGWSESNRFGAFSNAHLNEVSNPPSVGLV